MTVITTDEFKAIIGCHINDQMICINDHIMIVLMIIFMIILYVILRESSFNMTRGGMKILKLEA